MRHARAIPIVLIALFLTTVALAPLVAGQDAGGAPAQDKRPGRLVTFYGHVFGTGGEAPMPFNTQFPTGEENYGLGTFATCTPAGNFAPVPPVPSDGTNCADAEESRLILFSTPGFVDVTNKGQFDTKGQWALFHNERGQTKDIYLDTSGNVEAVIYMALDLHSWSVGSGETQCPVASPPRDIGCPYPYWGWDPGAYPDWTVTATLLMGKLGEHGMNASDRPPVWEAYKAGELQVIAEGTTTPTLVQNGIPGAPLVNEFRVNLGSPQLDKIPKENSFFLMYRWNSNTGGNEYSTHQWRIFSGEYFPARFTLPVRNAFDVESLSAKFVFGKLLLVGSINTPWGSYDVDPAATTLTITDEGGAPVTATSVEVFADYSTAHGGHYNPINATYIWDYKADGIKPGTYKVTLKASNWQHSVAAECTISFTIGATESDNKAETRQCGLATENLGGHGNHREDTMSPPPTRSAPVPLPGGASLGIQGSPVAAAPAALELAILAIALVAGLAVVTLRRWS